MDIKDIFTYLAFQVGLIYTLTRLMQDAGYSYMSFYLTDYLKLPTVSYRDDNVTGLHCCAVVFWARCLIVLSGTRSRTHLSGKSKANKVSDVSPIMWCCYLLWSSDCTVAVRFSSHAVLRRGGAQECSRIYWSRRFWVSSLTSSRHLLFWVSCSIGLVAILLLLLYWWTDTTVTVHSCE